MHNKIKTYKSPSQASRNVPASSLPNERRTHGFRYFGSSDNMAVQMRQRSSSEVRQGLPPPPPPSSRATIAANVVNGKPHRSNRSLILKVQQDAGNQSHSGSLSSIFSSHDNLSGAAIGGTVPLPVQKQPQHPHEAPVYVFDDEPKRPTLLQRSKTFFINRTASIRRSMRSSQRPAASTQADSGRISLVFGDNRQKESK